MLQFLAALGLFGTALLVLAWLRLRRAARTAAGPAGRFPRLERCIVWCAGASLTALAVTGFLARLRGQALAGYTLLFHVSCGGALAAAFTLALLFLAGRFRVEAEAGTCACTGTCCLGHRLGFWLLAVAILGTVVTPLVAMLPLAGTHGQEQLVALHRLFGLAAVLLALALTHAEARMRQARA